MTFRHTITGMRRTSPALPALLVLTPLLLAAAVQADSWALGEVVSPGVTLEGVAVPPGTTLGADSLLQTGEKAATVQLRGGQVVRLARHSSAYFEAVDGGAVRMAMRSGTARLRGSESEPLQVGENMQALLSPNGRSRVASPTADLADGEEAYDASIDEVGNGSPVGAPVISDAREPCISRQPYPILDAVIRPGADVRAAKLYFRAAQHPDLYAVEMQRLGDDFEAILPAPAPDTRQVVYYVEAVSSSFDSSRSAEYTSDVIDGERCRDRGGVIFEGSDPGISVLSTVPGSPTFPPGFVATTSQGGGLSPWAIGGIAAGAVAGTFLLLDDDDDQGTDEPPASPITPSRN